MIQTLKFQFKRTFLLMCMSTMYRKPNSLSMLNSGNERKRGYSAISGRSGDKDSSYRGSDKFSLFSNDEPTPLLRGRGLTQGSHF